MRRDGGTTAELGAAILSGIAMLLSPETLSRQLVKGAPSFDGTDKSPIEPFYA
jgi:hypothetical protein